VVKNHHQKVWEKDKKEAIWGRGEKRDFQATEIEKRA